MNSQSTQHHYWVDRIDPWIIHFSGDFGIRWYGVSYATGILFASWFFLRWARQGRLPVSIEQVPALLTYAATGLLVGGRLGYCLFYNLPEVAHHPFEVFAIWHGGMASHGGILGLVLALWLFAFRHDIAVLHLLDAAAAAAPLGIAFGRIANFVNGELWGRPATVPWAVIFPQAPLINGINVPRHPSQLYACAIEGLLVFCIAQWVYAKSHIYGTTTAAACVSYGIGRVIDEFWRQPDLGQPVYWGWMSKGQLLTIASISVQMPIAASVSTQPDVADGEVLMPKVQVLPMRPARRQTTRPRTLNEFDSLKPAIALAGRVNTKIVVVSAEQLQRERERAAPPEVRRPRVPAAGLSGRRAFDALFSDPTDPSEGSGQ